MLVTLKGTAVLGNRPAAGATGGRHRVRRTQPVTGGDRHGYARSNRFEVRRPFSSGRLGGRYVVGGSDGRGR